MGAWFAVLMDRRGNEGAEGKRRKKREKGKREGDKETVQIMQPVMK